MVTVCTSRPVLFDYCLYLCSAVEDLPSSSPALLQLLTGGPISLNCIFHSPPHPVMSASFPSLSQHCLLLFIPYLPSGPSLFANSLPADSQEAAEKERKGILAQSLWLPDDGKVQAFSWLSLYSGQEPDLLDGTPPHTHTFKMGLPASVKPLWKYPHITETSRGVFPW